MLLKYCVVLLILIVPTLALGENATCKAAGRYLDYTSPDCSNYILCIPTTDTGDFSLFNLKCPADFAFNPEVSTCTNATNFNCSSHQPQFNCTSIGRFHNPSDLGCDTYIECFVQYDGALKSRILQCPSGLNFDPVNRSCLSKALYHCEVRTTTSRPQPSRPSNGKGGASMNMFSQTSSILLMLFISYNLF